MPPAGDVGVSPDRTNSPITGTERRNCRIRGFMSLRMAITTTASPTMMT
ncbi:MAG: hypothetical protein JWL93_2296 [Hyphomicrobiales bacterium]|nr:hypothetical protein [Hyphomicrobiales bacterium]